MTQCKYRQYFNSRSASTSFMIRNLVGSFEELGSVADRPEKLPNEIFTLKTMWKLCAYFFENEDGTPETIFGASYRTKIEIFLRSMAEQTPNL
ncbi:hypothetical protein TNIN_164701 [Trichonephila inaurata madagascariensis]|uniref:Uncharacterized protein n=1 Tax=Trichonephila inaurata madagascariensis TaxID=2747483 RepID=A0A8X7C4X0_9ARAC|nr:hypothetical protein TNIN_164701 [Trichonephila inaurata madagascariensis]